MSLRNWWVSLVVRRTRTLHFVSMTSRVGTPGSWSQSPHLALEKLGEVLGVVAPNPEDAPLPVDHNAIPAPEVPDPAVPWVPMDSPAIQDRRAPTSTR